MKKELSIIVPVYNAERFLSRCVESILNQSYKNFELILVDDGSKDGSYSLCKEYASKDNRVIVLTKENGGASSARNMGLRRAVGEYIGFVDADDFILSDMYEYMINLIKKMQSDIVICDYTNNKNKLNSKKNENLIIIEDNQKIMEYFYRLNKEQSNYSVWNRVFSRKCLEQVSFLEGYITEDVLFTFDSYRNASKVVISNQIKYYYDIGNSGITKTKLSLKDQDLLYIWDKIVESVQDLDEVRYAVLNKKRAIFTLYCKSVIYGKGDEISLELMDSWKKEIRKNKSELFKILDWKRKILLLAICIGVV